MISKEKQKLIRALQKKKSRQEEWLFLVEWEKSILELLSSWLEIKFLYLTKVFISNYRDKLNNIDFEETDEDTLTKIGNLKSNNAWIAIVKTPKQKEIKIEDNELIVALDNINDPGNLWTIIRTCDWYGIKKIVCNLETVELTNPKVVSSTMWSLSRVQVYYTDLEDFLIENDKIETLWAFLDGENIHTKKIDKNKSSILVIWNESHGISKQIEKYIKSKITIPSFWWTAESLNAAIATAIILDNIVRN